MSDAAFSSALSGLSPEKRAMLAELLRPAPEPIAIIGMACRFPGAANSPAEFWRLLAEGHDAIAEVPAGRWPVDTGLDPGPAAPGAANTRLGGFIEQADQFDAAFFGIAPREAARMDPQQRLLLEVAWEALENAGLTLDELAGSATGVFVGIYQGDYSSLQMADAAGIDAYVAAGMSHAIAANRLSHFLDARGPSLAVDTACSSSLVALHLAVQSLRQKESSLALVGGVNLMLSPLTTLAVARWGAVAPDGRIKAFDAAADGMVRGEGCGVLVLKRLSEAQRDGDPILAVLRGTAVNQDGRTNVLTAPNGLAQRRVLAEALANAGLRANQIGYVEAHGTGTPLGDPIEMEALLAVYGERAARDRLYVGSVKTNIGHLEAAAGVAGLIKAVLVLQHGQVPPHLHFTALNPHISLGDAPITVPVTLMPWPAPEAAPRRAAVSSFGFGGTNAHVIMEAAPGGETPPSVVQPAPASDQDALIRLLALSAPQPAGLAALAAQYRDELQHWQAAGVPLAGICAAALLERTQFSHRLTVAGRTHAEMAAALDAFVAGRPHPSVAAGRRLPAQPEGPVFVFSGQGVQWEGMGANLRRLYPAFRQALDECDHAFRPALGLSLIDILRGDAAADGAPANAYGLTDTLLAQPAIFAVQVALAALWRSWGIQPAAVVGHSLGEVTAAYVAGALTLADAALVVSARSQALQSLTGHGKMAAVNQQPASLLPKLQSYDGLAIAAANGASSTVVSGDPAQLEAFLSEVTASGAHAQYLPVNYAFHSPQVRPLVASLVQALTGLRPRAGRLPLISTVTGQPIPGEALDAAYWGQNLAEPVLFARAIERLVAQGHAAFLEVSPHPALSQYVEQALAGEDRPGVVAHSLRRGRDDDLTLKTNLGRLHAHGLRLDWPSIIGGRTAWVDLPNYPWQRRRYWYAPESAPAAQAAPGAQRLHPLLDRQVRSPVIQGTLFESVLTATVPPFQGDHRIHGVLVVPATAFLEMADAAARRLFGPGAHPIRDLVIRDALVVPEDGPLTIQLVLASAEAGQPVEFQIFAAPRSAPEDWRLYARGMLVSSAREAPAEATFDITAVQARCPDVLDGAAYYSLGRDFGGTLGPRFQSLRRLWRREGEVLGRLEQDTRLETEAGGYTIHPAYLDAAFHIAYAAQTVASAEAGILMPVSFDEVCFYRSAGPNGWCHFELRPGSEPARAVGDSRVYDADSQLVAEAKGIRYLRAAGPAALLRHVRPASRDWLYRLAWQPQALVAPNGHSALAAGGWLILTDAGGCGEALAGLLRRQGQSAMLVRAAMDFAAGPDDSFTLNPDDPSHYRLLLASDWVGRLSAGCNVVDLRALDWPPAAQSKVRPAGQEFPLSLLYLTQAAIGGSGLKGRLWLVTRLSQPAGPERVDPAGALVWGFGRTLALEHPALFGGLIDLGEQTAAEAAALLASELLSPDGENQVAFRGAARLAARLARLADATAGVVQQASPNAPQFRSDATYLVTGGTGGIGRLLVRWLVEHGARHLVLLSRSVTGPDLEHWVADLRATGAEVRLAAADVADAGAVAHVLADLSATMPPLRGVFHAAGVVADAAIHQLSPAQLEAVMRGKVAGAWNLHDRTAALPLETFVCFSSAAAVLGSPGQANYAAANAALDALAHHRRGLGLPALSINWGPWQAGMAEAAGEKGRRRLDAWGMESLPPDHALEVLGRLLTNSQPQVAVLPMRWPPRTERALALIHAQPLFRELLRGLPPATQAARPPVRSLRQELAALPARRQKQAVVAFLCAEVAAILGWESGADIDPQQGFFDLGLDSLAAVELKERLESALDLPQGLPATVVFDYPTVEGLARHLLDRLSAAGALSPAPVASPDDLENLSEDELAALLADELRGIEQDK